MGLGSSEEVGVRKPPLFFGMETVQIYQRKGNARARQTSANEASVKAKIVNILCLSMFLHPMFVVELFSKTVGFPRSCL